MNDIITDPLTEARDHLREAHKVLSRAADTAEDDSMRAEIDAVLNEVTKLLLSLKAVGSDARWAE